MKKTIILATGGTGGHVFPAVALAERLMEKQFHPLFLTDRRGLAYIKDYEVRVLYSAGLSGRGAIDKLQAIFQLILGCIQALWILWRVKPHKIVAFGGYSAVPTLMGARLLRIPYIIHEQNAVMGRTNLFFAKHAQFIALTQQNTQKIQSIDSDKIRITGNPLRKIFTDTAIHPRVDYNQKHWQICITGGSQGAKYFGEIIPLAINQLPDNIKGQVIIKQQAKPEQIAILQEFYKNNGIQADIQPFFDNMPQLLHQSHLFIGRGGASTIAETAQMQCPAIIIPLKNAIDNHQYYNAANLADAGGCLILAEDHLTPNNLAQNINQILGDGDYYHAMVHSSGQFAKPLAVFALMELILI